MRKRQNEEQDKKWCRESMRKPEASICECCLCVYACVCLLSLEKQGVSEYGSGLSKRGTEVGQEIEVFVFLSCSCREHKGLSKGRAGGRGREGRRDREGVKQGGASGKTREGMGKARE